MILMDPRWLHWLKSTYTTPDPLTENIRDLDQQMQHILDRFEVPERDKARLYQQTAAFGSIHEPTCGFSGYQTTTITRTSTRENSYPTIVKKA